MTTASYVRLLLARCLPGHRDGGPVSLPDWPALGRILWAHKLFVVCLVLSALALTSVHVSQVPLAYEAETLVLLDQPKDATNASRPPRRQPGPESEALLFRSPAMAEGLADRLSLHLLPEFNPALRTEMAGLRDWFDPARLVPNSVFNQLPAALRRVLSPSRAVSDQQQASSLRAEVAARVLGHIAAEPAERPGVIRVRFVSTDPQLAALGANTLAELYLSDRLVVRQAASLHAQAFLRDEIARLRAAIAEASLLGLLAQVDPSGNAASTAAGADVSEADRELLATYDARLREIGALQEAETADARVIAVAAMPDEPIDPRRKLTFGMAFFGSLLVGSLAALGLERLDGSISRADQLGHLGLVPLGALPPIPAPRDATRSPAGHPLDDADGPFAQAVAALRGELVRANVLARRTSVLLTAALPGEGTTTTALCVACAHARAGGRALLVDCNLRRPRLHALTGADNSHGLTSILLGERRLEEILHRDERSGALIVPAGPGTADPKALLAGDAMRRLLQQAAEAHDLVILDGPPVLGGDDACLLARVADCTALLARWGSTPRQQTAAAAERLIGAGADMAGLVLTWAKPA